MDKLLTPQEVADLLGVQKSTIYQWTHQGYIPHVKLRNLVRFRPKAISEWVDRKQTTGRSRAKVYIEELHKS